MNTNVLFRITFVSICSHFIIQLYKLCIGVNRFQRRGGFIKSVTDRPQRQQHYNEEDSHREKSISTVCEDGHEEVFSSDISSLLLSGSRRILQLALVR